MTVAYRVFNNTGGKAMLLKQDCYASWTMVYTLSGRPGPLALANLPRVAAVNKNSASIRKTGKPTSPYVGG
jgi:hypothetical protein